MSYHKSILPLINKNQNAPEFSRLFALDKVGVSSPCKFQISANEQECSDLAKRLGVFSIGSFKADFNITKIKEQGWRRKGISVEGNAIAEVILSSERQIADQDVKILEFPVNVQFIAGKEEDYAQVINWQVEFTKDYDIEFYQSTEIDMGEIASQYLSLELDSFEPAEEMESEKHQESSDWDEKLNVFSVLEKLRNK
jgi:hypothetical protein